MLGEFKTWDALIPGQEELKENSRSRSARLRAFVKKNQAIGKLSAYK